MIEEEITKVPEDLRDAIRRITAECLEVLLIDLKKPTRFISFAELSNDYPYVQERQIISWVDLAWRQIEKDDCLFHFARSRGVLHRIDTPLLLEIIKRELRKFADYHAQIATRIIDWIQKNEDKYQYKPHESWIWVTIKDRLFELNSPKSRPVGDDLLLRYFDADYGDDILAHLFEDGQELGIIDGKNHCGADVCVVFYVFYPFVDFV